CTWCPASISVNAGLMGVTVPPRRHAAKRHTTSSTRLVSITASTSPRPKPSRASRPATASARASSSAWVRRIRSSATAGGDPYRSAKIGLRYPRLIDAVLSVTESVMNTTLLDGRTCTMHETEAFPTNFRRPSVHDVQKARETSHDLSALHTSERPIVTCATVTRRHRQREWASIVFDRHGGTHIADIPEGLPMPRITALLTALLLSCGGLALAAPAASAPSPVTISPVPRLKVGWDGRATLRPVVHKTAAGKRAGVRVTDKRVTVRRAGTVVGKKNRSRAKLRPGTYRVRAKATVVQRGGTAKRTVSRSFRTVVRQGSCPTKADVRTLKVGDALTPGVAGDVRADVDRKLRQKGRSTRHSVADLREELVLTLEQLADESGDEDR